MRIKLRLLQLMVIAFYLFCFYPCSALPQSRKVDSLSLKTLVYNLTADCKFNEAQNLVDEASSSADSALINTASKIQRYRMPQKRMSVQEEQLLRQARALNPSKELSRIQGLLKRCVTSFPNSEYAHIKLSEIYFLSMQDSMALSEARKAVALAPENLDALCNLGRCFIYFGQKAEALNTFNTIRNIDPKDLAASDFFYMMEQANGDISALKVIDRASLLTNSSKGSKSR